MEGDALTDAPEPSGKTSFIWDDGGSEDAVAPLRFCHNAELLKRFRWSFIANQVILQTGELLAGVSYVCRARSWEEGGVTLAANTIG